MVHPRAPAAAIFAACCVAAIGLATASCAHADPQSSSTSQAPASAITPDTIDAAVDTLAVAAVAPDSGAVAIDPAPSPVGSAAPVTAPAAGEAPLDPALLACHADADCVTVRKNACCNHGELEAVAATKVDAYKASFTCQMKHVICPQFLRRDTRVAKCDSSAGRCQLVAP